MTKAADLLDRVKAATGPDRFIDAELTIFLRPELGSEPYRQTHIGHWTRFDGRPDMVDAPKFTASVDAALALVEKMLPGGVVNMGSHVGRDGQQWQAELTGNRFCIKGTADALPLAILEALLIVLVTPLPATPKAGETL